MIRGGGEGGGGGLYSSFIDVFSFSSIYSRFQIVSLARGQHYQVACGRYFEVTHKVCRLYLLSISHPFLEHDMVY